MRLKATLLLTGFLGILGGLTSCSETSALVDVEMPAPVEETEGFPRTAVQVDTTITLRAYFRPSNGCGKFSYVDSTTTDNVTSMTIYAAYPDNEDVICADISKLISYQFRFNPKAAGTYYFHFWRGQNEYLRDSVVVK